MLWMKSFCFYCSVRMGVISSTILSIIQTVIPLIAIAIIGSPIFKNVTNALESDEEYKNQPFIRKILDVSKKEPEKFMLFIYIYLSIHIISCVLAIIGAYRLNKWFLLPYIIMEFIRLIITLSTHVIAMIVLKKTINLGMLIASTVTGGFCLLWIAYMWAGAVALFQIIRFVNTDKYQQLYGTDPFAQITPLNDIKTSIENIKIFSTPNYDEVDAIKMGNYSKTININDNNIKLLNTNNKMQLKNLPVNYKVENNYWQANELIGMVKKNKNNNKNQFNNVISYY